MDERKVKDIPKDERKHLIGQLDANTSFKEFFKQSDEFFQRTWLGETKYKLYKKGEYSIDKFADPLNKRGYTLAELKALDKKPLNYWVFKYNNHHYFNQTENNNETFRISSLCNCIEQLFCFNSKRL